MEPRDTKDTALNPNLDKEPVKSPSIDEKKIIQDNLYSEIENKACQIINTVSDVASASVYGNKLKRHGSVAALRARILKQSHVLLKLRQPSILYLSPPPFYSRFSICVYPHSRFPFVSSAPLLLYRCYIRSKSNVIYVL